MLKTALLILPLFLVACGDRGAVAGDAKAAAKAPDSAAAPDATAVVGTVMETMDAGAYTYVRLKTGNGETWAAVNQTALARGAEITVSNAMWMENFESKTLNRKFDRILFGMIASAPSLDAMAAVAELPAGHPATSSAAAASASQAGDILGDAKVDKATGKDARTVAEIWAQRKELSGREVVIRARVVKFNAQIMGKNWIHLRDGSGSAEKADNDLTVTTDVVVAKGDIVNVRGKVAIDRDFTAGYAYPVIIEEAKVIK